ncbi:MAG TPA: sodium:solute symporter [Rhodopirellula baltica]|uniref:High affinity choline transporter n=1 Tax=Rhodopirellula baltica (strain DSM 10527 / NCIMB 13988 / SH1) TaxID=243090 RepID=Q7UFM6_RHOBA|nr:sodium:solute symporter family protein [Rhodopirellula baltica]CAD78656.1 high affinity choline transporter [Rhodopirellula baltica SH 1]HBE65470.1 sodium:solute symporter [Rhodopirellula baltica]
MGLIAAVLAYLLLTIAIGLLAARRVGNAQDFMVAGRSLPLYMNFACVFATWFGAETVLSVSATFAGQGLRAIPGDPFGFSICLVLVALFFARAFYRMDLLTIGDFYRKRYGRSIEVLTSVVISASYLGWAAAQLTALGLVISVLGKGIGYETLTINNGIVIGFTIVAFYTVMGGMWSVALTDMIQTFVIIIGLLVVSVYMAHAAGGVSVVIESARESGRLQVFPDWGQSGQWWIYIGGFLTAALGSIPQQDVFQRVTSAKDERTAMTGTLLGGMFYCMFAFVPMFIAYAAVVIDPDHLQQFNSDDLREVQRTLPHAVIQSTPFWVQTVFLGALVSAILSTASGTLLAPSSLIVENVIRPFRSDLDDKNMLRWLRIVLLMFGALALHQALTSNNTMYEMIQQAYSVPLVGALVPLAVGLYWKRATTRGAMASIVSGVATWLAFEYMLPEFLIPSQLMGLAASFLAMVVVSLLDKFENIRPDAVQR